MDNSLFEQILQGQSVPLKQTQLGQFEIFCSTQNLSLQRWIEISLILFQQKREYCLHFLQYVQKNEIPKPIYNDFIHQDSKTKIYINLFALQLTKATKSDSKPETDLSEARRYLTQGENVKNTPNVLSRGFLEYFDGELTKATNMFNNILKSPEVVNGTANEDKMIAMIGLAQIYFLKKSYAKSLELYKSVLLTFKTLPVKARIGMAYCYFFMEKYEMARACFNRILSLKPDCIEAYLGLAVIEEKNENFIECFRYLSKSVKINRNHPLVLIHLSEHYLIKGDLEKASKLAQEGLVEVEKMAKFFVKLNRSAGEAQTLRNDYLQLKARFNNILGQVQHIKNNFLEALRYYRLASNQGLAFNEIYLSQVYTHPICQNYVEGLKILQKLFKESTPFQQKLFNQSLKGLAYLKSKNSAITSEEKTSEDYYYEAIAYNKNDIEVKIELSNQIMETKKSRTLKLLLTVFKQLEAEGADLIKPELTNNIGVLYLENHEYHEACHFLQHCVDRLQILNERTIQHRKSVNSRSLHQNEQNGQQDQNKIQQENHNNSHSSDEIIEEQSIKINANYLIALFNLAVVKEKLCHFVQATQIYEKIVQINKHFIDAHIRLAYVQFIQGNFNKAIETLDDALKQSDDNQTKFIRYDKVQSMKLAILKLWGDQVAAKDLAKQISKTTRDVYTQIYELSLQYEQLLKRQPELAVIKEFLRPNRQIYMRLCHDDPNNTFGYLVLCILLLTDKRISLKQGSQLFAQLKQHSSEEIPVILYNMALFFLNYDDYEKSKFIAKLYKEKTNDERGEQLHALANLLEGNYAPTIQSVKKSILLNPTNIKYRYQLLYATEKKIEQQRLDDKSKLKSLISVHLSTLKKCHKLYTFFSKLNLNDYIKNYEAPDIKEQTRNYGQKIRTLCDERKFYVGSNIDYYEKLQKDEMIRLKEEEEKERRNKLVDQFDIDGNLQERVAILVENNHLDESDSEQIKKKRKDQKKRKALQLARKKDQQINEKLVEARQKEREQRQKKQARATREPRQKGVKKRQKKVKTPESEDSIQYESVKSFIEDPSHQSRFQGSYDIDNEGIEAPKRKRRQERRQQRRQRKKKIKKERLARLSDEDLSGANPFEDTPHEEKRSSREDEESEEQFSRKKKKKEEKPEEDQDFADMNKYII